MTQRWLAVAVGFMTVACTGQGGERGVGQTVAAADAQAQLMQQGTTLLYQSADPVGAETVFRKVIELNPTHYGAHFQLAVSLDRGGKPGEARRTWEAVLKNAENAQDSATAATARSRLAAPDTASETAMMALGLDLLYRQNQPTAAAEQFRKVLGRNPTHYGATYQLATALDKSGQAAQARRLWEKVLGMAEANRDARTAQVARERLR